MHGDPPFGRYPDRAVMDIGFFIFRPFDKLTDTDYIAHEVSPASVV